MKVYKCHVCGNRTVGRYSALWWLALFVGCLLAPVLIGLIILLAILPACKRCPFCAAPLISAWLDGEI